MCRVAFLYEPGSWKMLICFSKASSVEQRSPQTETLFTLCERKSIVRMNTFEHVMASLFVGIIQDLRAGRNSFHCKLLAVSSLANDNLGALIERIREFAVIVGYLFSVYPKETMSLLSIFEGLPDSTKTFGLFNILVMVNQAATFTGGIHWPTLSLLPQSARDRYLRRLELGDSPFLSWDNMAYLRSRNGNEYRLWQK